MARPIARICLAVLHVILWTGLAFGTVRFFASSETGLRFLERILSEQEAGPEGSMRLNGLKGDLFERFSVSRVSLSDKGGAWLRADDVEITWSPLALLTGRVHVRRLVAERILLERPPELPAGETEPPDLDLEELSVSRLEIGPAIAGRRAAFTLRAAARSDPETRRLALSASPLDDGSERADLEIVWTKTTGLVASGAAEGPPGGVLASLLGAPDGAGVTFSLAARGHLDNLEGRAHLAFGATQLLQAEARRTPSGARAHIRLSPAGSGKLAGVLAGYSVPLIIDLSADRDGEDVRLSGDLASEDGQIEASLRGLLTEYEISGPIMASARMQEIATFSKDASGALEVSAMLHGAGTPDARGEFDVRLSRGSLGGVSFALAEGRFLLSAREGMVRTDRSSLRISGLSSPAARLTRDGRAEIVFRGGVSPLSGRARIDDLRVETGVMRLTASGPFSLRGGPYSLSGGLVLHSTEPVIAAPGQARAKWRLEGRRDDLRLTMQAGLQPERQSDHPLLNLLGRAAEIDISGRLRDSGLSDLRLDLSAPGAGFSAKGSVDKALNVSASGAFTLRRTFDAGKGLHLTRLQAETVLSGPPEALRVLVRNADIEANTDAGIALAGRLEASADLGSGASRVSFRGELGGQPFEAVAEGSAANDGLTIPRMEARYAGLAFSARDAALSRNGMKADIDIDGAPAFGPFSMDRFTGRIRIAPDGATAALALSATATGISAGEVRLDRITFEGVGATDNLSIGGRILAEQPSDLALDYALSLEQGEEGLLARLSARGMIAGSPAETPAPVRIVLGREGTLEADGALSLLDGVLSGKAALAEENSRIDLAVDAISVAPLARRLGLNPVEGSLSGALTLSRPGPQSPPSGTISLSLREATPAGSGLPGINAQASGRIEPRRLTLQGLAEGDGLSIAGQLMLPLEPSNEWRLAPSGTQGLRAGLTGTADAGVLWRLFGPSGQNLSGRLEADLKASGVYSAIELEGDARLEGARYEHGETGLSLTDLSAQAAFSRTGVRLTSLRAKDSQGGALSGEGAFAWGEALSGGLDLKADGLGILSRSDRSAVASGTARIELRPDQILVSGDLAVQQARVSIEQPAGSSIPLLPSVRRINFRDRAPGERQDRSLRPVRLDLSLSAPRRVVVFGRGADTEWGGSVRVRGSPEEPVFEGNVRLVRGTLDIAGERFRFNEGALRLDGPIRSARISIEAVREASDLTARVRVSGTPQAPEFSLVSEPPLPQDEILARLLFNRATTQLSGLEAAQLAAGLAELASGQGAFDPARLIRAASGLDRLSLRAEGADASVFAGKYITEDVYVQLGAGTNGEAGLEVEWEAADDLAVTSATRHNGESRLSVRWKKDY